MHDPIAGLPENAEVSGNRHISLDKSFEFISNSSQYFSADVSFALLTIGLSSHNKSLISSQENLTISFAISSLATYGIKNCCSP
ncbi:MAG: hypothetical protein ABI813_15850 [Bacteroidota bacterium]